MTEVLMCECPCHNEHPADCHHIVACCCPHRFVVILDCPDCTPALTAPPLPAPITVAPTATPRRTA